MDPDKAGLAVRAAPLAGRRDRQRHSGGNAELDSALLYSEWILASHLAVDEPCSSYLLHPWLFFSFFFFFNLKLLS